MEDITEKIFRALTPAIYWKNETKIVIISLSFWTKQKLYFSWNHFALYLFEFFYLSEFLR